MKQGEIWNANLSPTEGSELAGFRPVLIISGNMMNNLAPVIVICPLTTKLKRYHGNLILQPNKLNKLSNESELLTFYVRSVSKIRLKQKIGKISVTELKQVHNCLNDLLNY
jgi:mRNA interferase MazF